MEDQVSRRNLFHAAGGAAAVGAVTFPSVAQAQAPAGSAWEQIRSRGTLRMGVAPAEPWALKDPANNEWRGFSISLGRELATALSVRLEIEELTLATAVAAVQAGRVDMVPILDGTPQRALAVDFTPAPLVFHAQAVLVEDNVSARSWEDLNKPEITISVPQGSVMETHVRRVMPRATVLSFPNNPETVAAFQSRRANAASLFGPALSMLHARVRRGKIIIPTPTRVAISQIAVRREPDKTLRDWLDLATIYFYHTNQTQVWYEEFLRFRNIDPATVPAVRRELW